MRTREAGFTLIELIVLMVVFFGSLVALFSVSLEAGRRVADVDIAARAMQFAQQHAEMILADRRNPNRNYNAIPLQAASCNSISAACAYPIDHPLPGTRLIRSVQISDASASSLCPNPASGCKQVTVTLTRDARTVASVTLMLANS